jgi:hypothetical protein
MTLRFKIFTLGLIVALAATTQCFARCDVSAFLSMPAPMADHCHSHGQQHRSSQPCAHQHEQLANPEQGIDMAIAYVLPAAFAAVSASLLSFTPGACVCAAKAVPAFPPGGKRYVSFSSLRI